MPSRNEPQEFNFIQDPRGSIRKPPFLKSIFELDQVQEHNPQGLKADANQNTLRLKLRETILKRIPNAVNHTTDCIFVTDKSGRIVYVNPAFEKTTGYSFSESFGKTPSLLKSGQHSSEFYIRMWKQLLAGDVFHDMLINKKKDGSYYYAEQTITPMKEPDGTVSFFLSVGKDVTKRVLAEDAVDYRIQFEKIIMGISTEFISIPTQEIYPAIRKALEKVASFVHVDRAYLCLFPVIDGDSNQVIEWTKSGVRSHEQRLKEFHLNRYAWHQSFLMQSDIVHVKNTAAVPKAAQVEVREWIELGIQSYLFVPTVCQGKVVGFIGFDRVSQESDWPSDVIALLRIVGEIFVNALERKRIEQEVKLSEERYALAMEGSHDGLWDWDFQKQKIFYSARWKTMLGFGPEEIGESAQEWFDRVHPQDREKLQMKITAHTHGGLPHFQVTYRILHADRQYRWMLARGVAVRDVSGKVHRMAGSQTDITEAKRSEEQILHGAFYDQLTGAANRALLVDRVSSAIERSKSRVDYRYALVCVDLEHFHSVNENFGIHTGDQVLIEIVRRLENTVRSVDTVARLGGDKFAVFLDDFKKGKYAIEVAEDILKELTRPVMIGDQEIVMSANIGITGSVIAYERVEEVLRDAETAVARAQALGGRRFEIFDVRMHDRAMNRIQVEAELRKAIDRKEFRLFYQPIVVLATGELSGFEALIRWEHPTRGLLSPAEFLQVAEETGLIVPIGAWVLLEACQQARVWLDLFPEKDLTMSVNLSRKQFLHRALVDDVKSVLETTCLCARSLMLEVTEGILSENIAPRAGVIDELRKMGIRINMDDFGTGYSSFSQLNAFAMDHLKIDRSFINNLQNSKEGELIVRTIVNLGKTLFMDVVAEGIETADQLQTLRDIECHYGQGFFFSKPLPEDRAQELIQSGCKW